MKAGAAPVILVLSGQTGSGKTSLARELVLKLNANFVSFGSYVRNVATSRGVGSDRASLQDLGQLLIEEFGPDAFVREVLSSGQGSCDAVTVLDGVRSVEIWRAVQKLASDSLLIYLDIGEDERIRRLVERDKLEAISIRQAMRHSMEESVPELRPHADLILHGGAIDNMVSDIMLLLMSKGTR